ncbi:MAG: sugar phosphate isomerase/epimerase [Clostridia bacterium]|nr:sugar phosphate isomerase/epimerase [Clostridia bacterium]MBQ7051562.1 sugar phosphate isomerase/epimerase [Clostridia bacterium]
MIIGMRGHDFGRMQPEALAEKIAGFGFAATQLAFGKAFPDDAGSYMTPDRLASIRSAFARAGVAVPVMGCYVSASDRDEAVLSAAKEKFAQHLRASVLLGAGCVGTETTHFTFEEAEREAAYARLLDFTRHAAAAAKACGAIVGIEPVAYHTLNTPELTARLLADVGSDHLRVILDTANLVPPGENAPEVQRELLSRALSLFGDKVCVLHVKDGVWNSEGKWENRPLGEGIMDWETLMPMLRANNDSLCALREGVWPGKAKEEYELMCRWAGL